MSMRQSVRKIRTFLATAVLLVTTITPALAISPNPSSVVGPIAASVPPGDSTHDYTFFSRAPEIASQGYVEEEFFFSGTANSYYNVGSSTAYTRSTGNPYASRMVVRRPASASQFNGTVIVEWLNVSAGYDIDAHWAMSGQHFMRAGYAWVGVSAQRVGVHDAETGLRVWSPRRYGTASPSGARNITSDDHSYDIFSQAGKAIKSPVGTNVMGGFNVQRVIAAGASQSATFLVRYHNSIHPHSRGGVYDAYYILIGGSNLRTTLTPKVFKIYSETEIPFASRQTDSSKLRTWEVAGASHVSYDSEQVTQPLRIRDGIPTTSTSCDNPPFSRIPFHHAQNAAYDHLVRWVRDGIAPPTAPRITTSGTFSRTITRDSRGNALGGLRLSQHAVPTAQNTGQNSGPDFCILLGTHVPFSATTLRSLYPTHTAYVNAVTNAVNQNLASGYIVQADGQISIQQAQQANIPPQ